MNYQRSRIYCGLVVLWAVCAVVLGIQSELSGRPVFDRSVLLNSSENLSSESSLSSSMGKAEPAEPLSVLIYREPKGKRKLEPQADSSEWQVILRWALTVC